MRDFFIATVLVILGVSLFNFINPTDPTEKDRWDRSGMNHYIDYGTGCEYLSGSGFFGKSVLIKRLDSNGKHICRNK